jgi:methyl-accepting chemotaxis protein
MSFIDDMKIGKKLIGGFLIVLIILVAVAGLGYMNLQDAAARQNALYEKMQGTENLALTNAALEKMRGDIYRYIAVPADRPATSTSLATQVGVINDNMKEFRSRPLSAADKASLDKFDTAWATMQVTYKKLETDTDKGDTKAVDAGLAAGSPAVTARTECLSAVKTLVTSAFNDAERLNKETNAATASASLMMMIATIIAVILGVGIALFISKSITGPLDLASKNLKEMGMGHLGNRMKMTRKDEIGEMATVMDTFSDNLQVQVVGTMKKIAAGDLSTTVKPMDAQDEIGPALITMTNAINALTADTKMLAKSAVEGKLDTRADASKHQGDYKAVIEGVNHTLDAVIGPLNVAAEYVDRISKGDIPKKITDNYNGDFNEIKNNLNNCIDNLNALNADAAKLAKAAVEGKLDTRADASKHMGDYRKIMEGVNATLDSVIGPLNMAADYVDKISKGKIPPKITDSYNGDFNLIKNNLNQCIDAINLLVADANMLSKAAVEGKLDTRADATKHQGDYWQIIAGVNKTLDSIIGPLNMAADSVDRISKGDIPARITDNYNGDFNEIKNNLNNCIDAVNLLVVDAGMLSKAADEGKLKTRADASKHRGDYKKIIDGVNQTLDSVIEPVNEALRVSKGYATQDFTTRVDPNLKVPGDWLVFKEALNNIGIAVSAAVTNIGTQVTDLAASAEEANASVEEVTAGAGQVAKNTSAVSVNVEKSMAGIEQVQKAMEDLSHTIQEVATRADVTAKLVQDTTTYSKEGMDLARKTENGMQGITKSSNEVNTIILEIKGQMDKISEIVNLITDLANQTNLLALNAAIEAARAGDAGRGFAVVATEVKSLAVESRASAEKISEMINNLQTQTNSAVDAVASANSGVKVGSEALHDTLSSFTKIVESIDQVSKNISDVAAAAEEQAASVEEVTASVNEVGGLMQSTAKESTDAAAASEESAAAIDQIAKVVGNVNNIVDKVTKEVSRFKC